MSALALVGGLTAVFKVSTREALLPPLVALAAGTLLGGAFFHMIPAAQEKVAPFDAAGWIVAGFVIFFLLDQLLHWYQFHSPRARLGKPMTTLILVGDGIHNFIGGLAIASTFLVNPQAGMVAWAAAAAHEVPQEMGDFGVLVHGGFSRRRALFWNVVSALTFPVGAVLAYILARNLEVAGLMLFGAGNFIYIGASALLPEIKPHERFRSLVVNAAIFGVGLLFTYALADWLRY